MKRWMLVLVLSLVGCGTDGATTTGDAPLHIARVALTIGMLDGEEPYVLGRVTGLTADREGNIYVADGQANAIRRYGPDGRFEYDVAAEGLGPGAVSGPCCLAFDPEGHLWVRERVAGRYQSFEVNAERARSAATQLMYHGSSRSWTGAVTFRDGALVGASHAGTGTGIRDVVRTFYDVAGKPSFADTIPGPHPDSIDVEDVEFRLQTNRPAIIVVWGPFGSLPLLALGPDGRWASAASGYYAVRVADSMGTVQTIAREVAGPLLSDRERDSAATRIDQASRLGDLPFNVPERKAPLRALMFDQQGRLWVELSTAEGAPHLADVFATDGTRAFQVTWPADVELEHGWLGDGYALGVRTDSLGVNYVVRLEWES